MQQRDSMDVSASRKSHVQQTRAVWVSFSMYKQAWYSKCKMWWCFKDAKEKGTCVCVYVCGEQWKMSKWLDL